jgi:hypothetical protein
MNATNSTPLDCHGRVNSTQKIWLELGGVSEEKKIPADCINKTHVAI